MIRFITDTPACYVSDIGALVITDVHIGIEHELWKSGITIPSQADKFLSVIRKLVAETGARRLIILGDVKYKVPGMSIKELRDIPRFLEELKGFMKVDICRGNHDDYLETILPRGVRLHGSGGFKVKKYGFFHGHAWPNKSLMSCDHLFMGHIQPAIEFRDSLGYRFAEQVWVRAVLDSEAIMRRYKTKTTGRLNLVVVPSFNRLSGAFVINSGTSELGGPLADSGAIDAKKMKLYLLDGTLVGTPAKMISKV